MNYRIENGEARIPLSELNRLNDEFERLESLNERLTRIEDTLEENSVATKVKVSVQSEYVGFGLRTFDHVERAVLESYTDLDGALKNAVLAEKEYQEKIIKLNRVESKEKIKAEKEKLSKVESMSILSFIKHRSKRNAEKREREDTRRLFPHMGDE